MTNNLDSSFDFTILKNFVKVISEVRMNIDYYVINAFADSSFSGNPAGVCVLDHWIDEDLMQLIAFQNNLSETGFVVKTNDDPCEYEIRWFTPVKEIDLCGHCTFGSAYVLFEFYEEFKNKITFKALMKGIELVVNKDKTKLKMNFPIIKPVKIKSFPELEVALGVKPVEVLKTDRDLLAILDSEETVKNLNPDFTALEKLPIGQSCFVSALSDNPEFDIVARAFWPKLGINEDPVCGSMHSVLFPYWEEKLSKETIKSNNLSKRGGTVECRKIADDIVELSGTGNLFLKGTIILDNER